MINRLAFVELGRDVAASKNFKGTASRFDENLTTWLSAVDAALKRSTVTAAAYVVHLPERIIESSSPELGRRPSLARLGCCCRVATDAKQNGRRQDRDEPPDIDNVVDERRRAA